MIIKDQVFYFKFWIKYFLILQFNYWLEIKKKLFNYTYGMCAFYFFFSCKVLLMSINKNKKYILYGSSLKIPEFRNKNK